MPSSWQPNLADDADTVAAVTGQIAGAILGLSGIPERWLDILAWRPEIEDRGRRLLARRDLCLGANCHTPDRWP